MYSVQKKAQQRLYFLRQLRKLNLPKALLTIFNHLLQPSFSLSSAPRSLSGLGQPPNALDPLHPGHKLFNLLPSGRRYRAMFAKTSRHKVSFFPQAVTLLNPHVYFDFLIPILLLYIAIALNCLALYLYLHGNPSLWLYIDCTDIAPFIPLIAYCFFLLYCYCIFFIAN